MGMAAEYFLRVNLRWPQLTCPSCVSCGKSPESSRAGPARAATGRPCEASSAPVAQSLLTVPIVESGCAPRLDAVVSWLP